MLADDRPDALPGVGPACQHGNLAHVPRSPRLLWQLFARHAASSCRIRGKVDVEASPQACRAEGRPKRSCPVSPKPQSASIPALLNPGLPLYEIKIPGSDAQVLRP
jgi:hypothetical protein